jgi:formylglycine-generating enzyme required for sulfatase activity
MPNKLFISYPSESWMFAQRLAENLTTHLNEDLFIDYRSIDDVDFEKAILGHLRTSQAVLLVITEYTFADIHKDDDWVRREIRTALECNIPIILVRENGLLPPRDLPEDVRDLHRSQGIPFYKEYFPAAITSLKDFVITIGVGTPRTAHHIPQVITVSAPAEPAPPPAVPEPVRKPTLDEAGDLMDVGDYEQALFILQSLQQAGLRATLQDAIVGLIADCQAAIAKAEREREAALEYAEIKSMSQRRATEAAARTAFTTWLKTYPDLADLLDSADLRSRFPAPQPRTVGERSAAILPQPFAWIPIPAGQVTIEDTAIQVPTFAIAKYPLTNAQYKPFIDAGGYKERRWWTDAGWDARAKGWEWQGSKFVETGKAWTQPRYWGDSQWNGAEQPVVGVSWYEAVAYCRWLSEHTGDSILLPSEAQWQRAAQGDDGREYPWGNDWQDGKLCNNSVDSNNSSKTTPVRRYEGKGDSPFGVVDMAGNVWEWCGTAYETGSEDLDGTDIRVLRGGSWYVDDTDRFRCASRGRSLPHYWYADWGFRLALSV